MQPTTPTRRPVIDVTAPHRAAVAPAVRPVQKPAAPVAPPAPVIPAKESPELAVHEAPQESNSDNWLASQQAFEPKPEKPAAGQPEEPAKEQKPAPEIQLQPKPNSPSPAPVAAIIIALFVMAALAALTVMVYLQS